jgi:hypothetical protein
VLGCMGGAWRSSCCMSWGVGMLQVPSCGGKLVSRISRCLCNSASRSTPYSSVLPLCTNWAGLSIRTDDQPV